MYILLANPFRTPETKMIKKTKNKIDKCYDRAWLIVVTAYY